MKYNAGVEMTVTINYENIEADTKEEAEKIAEKMAGADIDYHNCNVDCSSVTALAWESEG